MSSRSFVYDFENLSVSKFICIVDQGLFDSLVSRQNHHFLRSKIHCEYISIFLGKLIKETHKVVLNTVNEEGKCINIG